MIPASPVITTLALIVGAGAPCPTGHMLSARCSHFLSPLLLCLFLAFVAWSPGPNCGRNRSLGAPVVATLLVHGNLVVFWAHMLSTWWAWDGGPCRSSPLLGLGSLTPAFLDLFLRLWWQLVCLLGSHAISTWWAWGVGPCPPSPLLGLGSLTPALFDLSLRLWWQLGCLLGSHAIYLLGLGCWSLRSFTRLGLGS